MKENPEIFNSDVFNEISPQKLKLMVDMLNDMSDKSLEQKVQVLFNYGIKMKQKGLQFSKNESNLIIDSMKQNLSTNDKSKLDMVVNMMDMM